jgi:hypothetical protein
MFVQSNTIRATQSYVKSMLGESFSESESSLEAIGEGGRAKSC